MIHALECRGHRAADGQRAVIAQQQVVLGTEVPLDARAFVVIERRATDPLAPLGFFANRQRSGTLLVLTLVSTAMFGVYFFMTLYLQRVWDYSALRTALVYIPLSLILMAGAKVGAALFQ